MRHALALIVFASCSPAAAQTDAMPGMDMKDMAMEMSSTGILGRYPMSRDASGALSRSPIRTRYSGVTERAMVSPIAS